MKAERIAHKYLAMKAGFGLTKLPKVDKRTKVGKLALEMIYKLEKTYNFEEVREKKKLRNLNRVKPFTNILSRPLVKDYINNKHSLKKVHENRLEFYGRNHWAKDELDLRILKKLVLCQNKN